MGMNLSIATSAGLLFAATIPARGVVLYTVMDLGTLGGSQSYASGINIWGEVVGTAKTADGRMHAFRTVANSPINPATDDLGPSLPQHAAYGINSGGQTVGTYQTAPGQAYRTPPGGRITDPQSNLRTAGLGDTNAIDINDAGQVAGSAGYLISGGLTPHAIRVAAGSQITASSDLGTLGGTYSYAYGINASGQVVGSSQLSRTASYYHAFRTTATGDLRDHTADIGTLGGISSYAWEINDAGQTVGESSLPNNQVSHAFRTSPTGNISDPGTDLGTLGGSNSGAKGINSEGTVVGWAHIPGDVSHAFVCFPDGIMTDLNLLVDQPGIWTLTWANDINDIGQIVGRGYIDLDGPGGTEPVEHAFLLTRIPEPSSLGLLGLGAVGLRGNRRLRLRGSKHGS